MSYCTKFSNLITVKIRLLHVLQKFFFFSACPMDERRKTNQLILLWVGGQWMERSTTFEERRHGHYCYSYCTKGQERKMH